MLVAVILAVLLVAATLVSAARPAAATGTDSGNFVSAVNASRAQSGLAPYTLRSDLSSVAYSWAKHMAASGTLSHNPDLANQVSNWTYLGENVGYGPDWRTIENALMKSPSHRANILDRDFTEIGVGVVVVDGRMWVTQVFRRPAKATTTTTKTTSKTSTKTTTKTVTKPTSKPATKPVAKPVTKPTSKPATRPTASPAPTAEDLLRSRIDDAARTLRESAEADPVAQAGSFVTAMDIVVG